MISLINKNACIYACKKVIAFLVIMSIVVTTIFSTNLNAQAATNKETLILNVSNPSNGVITFYLKVPAGKTVDYTLSCNLNKRTGSIDGASGSVTNKTDKDISKKITLQVAYYSNKYSVTASYYTGVPRNKKIYSDTDSVTSALKTTVYTNRFVWNEKNIKNYRNGKLIGIGLSYAITGAVDLVIAKGYASGAWSTVLTVSGMINDVASAGSVPDTKKIVTQPIKGWAYRYKLEPYSGGYKQYLLIYNASGQLHHTIFIRDVPVSLLSTAYR